MLVRDIIRNLNKAWRGLAAAPKINSSPLISYANRNAYITASDFTFRSHLRHVGIRQGRNWSFCVSSDADLITAWLANVAFSGREILDPEATSVSLEKFTLVDLVEPPDLLIIRLGVKSTRNVAMPEVFLEAISHRHHIGKPTWVVDQSGSRFEVGHLCFSDSAVDILKKWDYFELESMESEKTQGPGLEFEYLKGSTKDEESVTEELEASSPSADLSLSGMTHSTNEGARRVELPQAPEKKRNKKSFRGSE
jgi:hypothetical protein